jgi:hypothetical protein
MKRLSIIITAFLAVAATTTFAQNCSNYIPFKANSGYEMQEFKANGKLTGTSKTTITSVSTNAGVTIANITGESSDDKGKSQGKSDYTIKCNGTSLSIDMKAMMNPQSNDAYKDMQVTFTSTDLDIPSTITVGTTLKDASMTMTVVNNGMTFSEMTINIINRKVESQESVTTPLGTFNCFKISYDCNMVTKTMGFPMKVNTKAVQYLCADKGVIKSEVYNEKGKLESYSLMSKVF